ncbi:STAS domain-containing protein [Actinoplanes sp. NPDC051859]|uniref:STAS domain-containing protein n=1 Tax=Actinoplanes sp. NPDC051859 TaxID=3363909 RepID=UPI0037A144C2
MTDRRTGDPLVASQTPLTVTTARETDDYVRLRCVGEIDQSSVPCFAAALDAALPGRRLVEVDLSQVTFMDSSGINTLVKHRVEGCELVVVDVPRHIRRILEITGLHQIFCR